MDVGDDKLEMLLDIWAREVASGDMYQGYWDKYQGKCDKYQGTGAVGGGDKYYIYMCVYICMCVCVCVGMGPLPGRWRPRQPGLDQTPETAHGPFSRQNLPE